MKRASRFRQLGERFLTRLGAALLPWLPRRAVVALARGLGTAAYLLARRERRVALANLDLAFGAALTPARRSAIARSAFQSFALLVLDLFWFSRRTEARVRRHVHMDPSMRAVFEPGAVVVVSGHLGNWEALGLAVGLSRVTICSVATPVANPAVDQLLIDVRELTGQRIVPRQGALRVLLQVIRQQGKVALLLDQNTLPEEGGTFVSFFGLPVAVSRAAATICARSRAPVCLTWCLADGRGSYTGHGLCVAPDDPAVKREGLTQHLTRLLEQRIREHPEQWLWSYKRWKFIPPGASAERYPFYARRYESPAPAAGGAAGGEA